MNPDKKLLAHAALSVGKSFRGSIYENAKRFKLAGKAYEALHKSYPEQDGHFDIKTARHLQGPLDALTDPNVREAGIIGASQVLKSVVGDIWTPYIIEHVHSNMAIYFEDDPKAKLFADTRLMSTIRAHPFISGMICEVEDRYPSKTSIKVAGSKIQVMGLNDGNVSSLSWRIIWISEAWQHKSDGLLKKARERADRFPNSCKILCESRAGRIGEDLHRYCQEMVSVPLTWACPHCGGRQTWDFSQLRPDGTYAGMTFPKEGTIEERAKKATWECLHCRQQIVDTRETRQKIMDTYRQDYKVNGVSPRAVCFYLPKEAALDNSFEKSTLSFLTAKEAERMQNKVPIEDWFMSERATFYSEELTQAVIISSKGEYDPHAQIPNENYRGLIIDVQQSLEKQNIPGSFWAEAYSADNFGNSRQLERVFVKSWESLDKIQERWKIENQNVGIDGRKWTPEILRQVASRRVWMRGINNYTRQPCLIPVCWAVLLGDGVARSFPWTDHQSKKKQYRVYSYPSKNIIAIINEKGQSESIPVYMYQWSNLSIKDQLHQLRIGGEGLPKMEVLAFGQLSAEMQAVESERDKAYDTQMSAEIRMEKNGKGFWDKIRPNNHYWDLACMKLVMMARKGLAGHVAAAE